MRLFLVLAAIFGIGWVAIWLGEHPGTITYDWQGETDTLSTTEAAALAAGAALIVAVLALLLRALWRWPSTMKARRRARRRTKGVDALSKGIVAVGAGDVRIATRASGQALSLLPDAPVASFLAAQAAQLA
ncbi:MAG: heme biosynthesis HemY N-terminal domain-containing protein, partial [Pseudomonadota bacterium]